jgi:transposase InsO family protein
MSEEIHQVSLADTQTSPPAHPHVGSGRFLPTLRGPHDSERIRYVQGPCGNSNRSWDQSFQTSSPWISRNPTNELTRGQISLLDGNRQRIWRSGSSIRPYVTKSKQPFKATMHSWPPARKALERIHIEFDRPQLGSPFLIVVDAWSKYADVISVSSTTSWITVSILLELCAQHCVPDIIVSDKGTQFTSHEFREFCKSDAICHILSSHVPPQIKCTARTLFRHIPPRAPETVSWGRCGYPLE